MIASLAFAILAAPPISYPPAILLRPIDDEEIIWATNARERFWLNVLRRASREEAVLERLHRRGLPSLCREFDEQRGRLVARFSRPFTGLIVNEVRRSVEPSDLLQAVDHASGHYSPWLPQTELNAWKEKAAAATAAFTAGAAAELAARFSKWNDGYRGSPVGARLKPEALAKLRAEPDLLPFWCGLPEPTREKAVGGYLRGGE